MVIAAMWLPLWLPRSWGRLCCGSGLGWLSRSRVVVVVGVAVAVTVVVGVGVVAAVVGGRGCGCCCGCRGYGWSMVMLPWSRVVVGDVAAVAVSLVMLPRSRCHW